MAKGINIKNILKALMIVLSVTFMLTACSGEEGAEETKGKTEMFPADGKSTETVAAHSDENSCWVSGIVVMIYDAMGTASLKMYSELTNGALTFMMMAFAIWMALRMLEHLSSVKEVNPNEFWTEILRKMALCFVCGVIASSTGGMLFILNTVIFPIYNAFLEFGAEILNVAVEQMPWAPGDDKAALFGIPGKLFGDSGRVVCRVTGVVSVNLNDANPTFPEGPKKMMECLICAVWRKLDFGYVLALEHMKSATLVTVLVGVLIFVCFTIVKLGFSFYIVDTVFRMAMMCVLLPLLVMSYAFKKTSKYAGMGFKIILSSSVFMMFISIVIAMTLMAIQEVMTNSLPQVIEAGNTVVLGETQDTSGETTNTTPTKRDLNAVSMSLVLICFLLVGSIGVAQQVTGSLLDTDISAKFQEKIKALGEGVFSLLTGGAGALMLKVKKVREVAEAIKKARDKIKHAAGRDRS